MYFCGKSTQGKPCIGPVMALYGIAVWRPNACMNPVHFFSNISVYILSFAGSVALSVNGCGFNSNVNDLDFAPNDQQTRE